MEYRDLKKQKPGHRPNSGRKAFTLIELLIVIAIILILIAIALPNFLEAQIRAKVTKAKSEMRSLGIALESYHLDWNIYPSISYPNYTVQNNRKLAGLTWLTSPNAYITAIPEDPFPGDQDPGGGELTGGPFSYVFIGTEYGFLEALLAHPNGGGLLKAWALYSLGPDSPKAELKTSGDPNPVYGGVPISSYSPTNGTRSKGDILRYGGDPRWMGVAAPEGVGEDGLFKTYPKPGQVVDGVRYLHRFPQQLTQ